MVVDTGLPSVYTTVLIVLHDFDLATILMVQSGISPFMDTAVISFCCMPSRMFGSNDFIFRISFLVLELCEIFLSPDVVLTVMSPFSSMTIISEPFDDDLEVL